MPLFNPKIKLINKDTSTIVTNTLSLNAIKIEKSQTHFKKNFFQLYTNKIYQSHFDEQRSHNTYPPANKRLTHKLPDKWYKKETIESNGGRY